MSASLDINERGRIESRLKELGVFLPTPALPRGNYRPCASFGSMIIISGQIPTVDGAIFATGRIGADVRIEDGVGAARICFLNMLAQLRLACGGDLDRVIQVVRLGGFVVCAPGFADHALIMNGASDLAVEIFGDAGRHSRTTVGVESLPGNAAIGIEGMFEVAS